jgi:hypothetical protein
MLCADRVISPREEVIYHKEKGEGMLAWVYLARESLEHNLQILPLLLSELAHTAVKMHSAKAYLDVEQEVSGRVGHRLSTRAAISVANSPRFGPVGVLAARYLGR